MFYRISAERGNVFTVDVTKAYRGSGGIASLILNFGARWRWVVNVTPRPPYPWGGSPLPIEEKAGGPRGRSRRCPYQDSNPGPSSWQYCSFNRCGLMGMYNGKSFTVTPYWHCAELLLRHLKASNNFTRHPQHAVRTSRGQHRTAVTVLSVTETNCIFCQVGIQVSCTVW